MAHNYCLERILLRQSKLSTIGWICHESNKKDELDKEEWTSWSAYHVYSSKVKVTSTRRLQLMPLFYLYFFIVSSIGETKSIELPFFLLFTGCDTTSGFFRRGKKIAWNIFSEITTVFSQKALQPFKNLDAEFANFGMLERYSSGQKKDPVSSSYNSI